MKPLSFLQQLRVTRRRCKSQAFVEFAFILPIFLIMMMGVFDYSRMVMFQQIMAMAAREAANTATRQTPDVAINVGLNAAYNSARSVGVDFSGVNGGVIITHVWYDSSYVDTAHVLLLDSSFTGPPANSGVSATDPNAPNVTNAVGGMGGIYGSSADNLFNKSRILGGTNGSVGWQSIYRQLPFPGTDLVNGDTRGVYAVEVYYTNAFITPIGTFMTHFDQMGNTFLIPGQLYDAAFYGVITGTPTSQIVLPNPNTVSHPPPPPPPPPPPKPPPPPPPPPPRPPPPPPPPPPSKPPPPPPPPRPPPPPPSASPGGPPPPPKPPAPPRPPPPPPPKPPSRPPPPPPSPPPKPPPPPTPPPPPPPPKGGATGSE